VLRGDPGWANAGALDGAPDVGRIGGRLAHRLDVIAGPEEVVALEIGYQAPLAGDTVDGVQPELPPPPARGNRLPP
jgi:hypothetical protein